MSKRYALPIIATVLLASTTIFVGCDNGDAGAAREAAARESTYVAAVRQLHVGNVMPDTLKQTLIEETQDITKWLSNTEEKSLASPNYIYVTCRHDTIVALWGKPRGGM